MTDGYGCYQNAMAERINGILKNEFLLSRPADLVQTREMVKESVAIYNHERPHLALKYKTPDEVHQPFYGQKTVNLYQEQLKPGAYFHERRSLNNPPVSA